MMPKLSVNSGGNEMSDKNDKLTRALTQLGRTDLIPEYLAMDPRTAFEKVSELQATHIEALGRENYNDSTDPPEVSVQSLDPEAIAWAAEDREREREESRLRNSAFQNLMYQLGRAFSGREPRKSPQEKRIEDLEKK